MPDPKIGSCVLLHINDEVFPAIVTNVFHSKGSPAMVNLAFTADEQDKEWYGRQVQNETSICHESTVTPGNMFWSHFSNPCTCTEGVLVIDPITGMSRVAENYEGP